MSSETNKRAASLRLPSRKSIPPFESLRAFDAVARLGGIRKAAQALMRDHAVVSRHLKSVEDWTGCQLFDRTPGGVVLTEEGRIYHQQIKASIDQISEATIALMKRSSDRSLQVWCMPGFAIHWMARHLQEFDRINNGVDLELRSTGDEPDFNRHEADVNIRIFRAAEKSSALAPGLRCQRIARPKIVPVASPDYLAQCEPITQPKDLIQCALLHEEDFGNWEVWFGENGIDEVDDLAGIRLWDGHMTLAAARHGRGIALSNHLIVANDIANGRLVEVGAGLASFAPVSLGSYYFVARSDRWDTPAIAHFRRWLMRTVNQELKSKGAVERGEIIQQV